MWQNSQFLNISSHSLKKFSMENLIFVHSLFSSSKECVKNSEFNLGSQNNLIKLHLFLNSVISNIADYRLLGVVLSYPN